MRPSLRDFLSQRFIAGGQPLTQLFSQRLGALLAWLALRLNLKPNTVTTLGLICNLAGASYLALDLTAASAFTAFLLLQLAYGLDCADGQLARATGATSSFGKWWDVTCDFFSLMALGAALTLALIAQGLTPTHAVLLSQLYLCGRILSLISSSQSPRSADAERTLKRSSARIVFTTTIDTPTQIIILCLARQFDNALVLAMLLLGAASLLHGVVVARNSLRQPVRA